MSEDFGPTFITVTDEDGKEIVLEFVDALEYNGQMYQAFFPAETEGEDEDPDAGLVILKTIHEDGEDLLSTLDSDEELEAIKTFFDFFYDDTRYSDWVIMEDFLPATSTGGEIMAAADESAAAWVDIVGSSKFYPTAKAEWADVKQGVIKAEQTALLGGSVKDALDELQAQIAGS